MYNSKTYAIKSDKRGNEETRQGNDEKSTVIASSRVSTISSYSVKVESRTVIGDSKYTSQLTGQAMDSSKDIHHVYSKPICGRKEKDETIPVNENTRDPSSNHVKVFMQRVGLKRFYPQSLQLKDVMKIKDSMKLAKLEDIALIFIKNLVMINYTCRDQMLFDFIENISNGLGDEKKVSTASATSQWENFLEDDDDDDENDLEVNPLDLVVAAFKCSNSMLKQILSNKLFMCKLAIPFIFPTFGKECMEISIWPLRSIILESKTETGQNMSVDCSCELVSFVRLGRPSQSKSKLINEILVDQYHNTFFNKDCPLGNSTRKISEGLVEAAWHLPSSKSTVLRNAIMFLNLRGDGLEHGKQLNILSKLSDVMIVIVDIDRLDDIHFKETIEKLHLSNIGVVLAIDGYQHTKKKVKEKLDLFTESISKFRQKTDICILSANGQMRGTSTIRNEMRTIIAGVKSPVISLCQRLQRCQIRTDEDNKRLKNNMDAALEILDLIPQNVSNIKDKIVPLQGTPWCTWSNKLKAVNKSSQYKNIHEESKLRQEMDAERQKQVTICNNNFGPVMSTFIQTLSQSLSADNSCMSFIVWLKLFLDERSRRVLPEHLSKYQLHWKALKTARDNKENEDTVKRLRAELDGSERQLAEASFGFEHLCREMGQIYEALHTCQSSNPKLIGYLAGLSKIAAKMLLLGQPFEIMDGDAANVPLTWVKAVLNQLKEMLGEQRILALSVLGIQSSGKSTLLNTMFGLQFAVSAGRCTRGVFMQLVPVELKVSKFDYVLVIDTEGLRAPELAHQKHSHDNELATFVIGLGDITIINIKGENTAEMKDVLQIAVHAFLRLKLANDKLNLKQSCVFVHQNVPASDANDKMMHGRQKFVEILDDMTKEAADQENIVDIRSFNQVIDFDIEKNVWYFSDLWRGDPPMAPANPGYSESVNTVKEAIMYKLMLSRDTYLTLTDTITRIEDLWNGILKDDFVFSFRNSLELKAYNNMEEECQKITWKLEKHVLEFLKSEAKSRLLSCKQIDDLEKTVPELVMLLSEEVNEKVKVITTELDTYIEKSSLKDVMIQWTQSKRNRFSTMAQTLIMKAQTDITSTKEEIRIEKLRLSEKTQHEMEINKQAMELALEMKGKKPRKDEIEQSFNVLWNRWINKFGSKDVTNSLSIKDQIECAICDKFISDSSFIKRQLDTVYFENRPGLEGAISFGKISKYEHLSIHTCKSFFGGEKQGEKTETCRFQAVDVANMIFRKIDIKLNELKSQDIRFDSSYVTEILNTITYEIKQHNDHKDNDYKFNLLPPFRALIVSHVLCYAVVFFTEMNDKYNRKHSPKAQMEEYKGTAWVLFKNTVDSRSEDAIAVGFFRETITKIAEEHVKEVVPIDAQESIRILFAQGKYSLIKNILTDLAEMDDFSKYKSFILDPRSHAERWIMDLMNDELFTEDLHGITQYARLAKTRIIKIFSQVKTSIQSATSDCRHRTDASISVWIDAFVKYNNISKTMPLSNDFLVHVKNGKVSKFEDFESMLTEELVEMEHKVINLFEKTTSESVQWKKNPVSAVITNLWGCTALCIFCKEPCKNTNKDHVSEGHSHICLQHRPQAIGSFVKVSSGKLVVEFCNHLVSSGLSYEMTGKSGPYKDYKNHFPDWDIPPNSDTSKYWMWVVCKYKHELTKMYGAEPPDIPDHWTSITKQMAIDSL